MFGRGCVVGGFCAGAWRTGAGGLLGGRETHHCVHYSRVLGCPVSGSTTLHTARAAGLVVRSARPRHG
eukprot:629252-Lingulodinium_polyedra.AAC.1